MQLVEQHVIRKIDPRYAAIDQAAFASKNLYLQWQAGEAWFVSDGGRYINADVNGAYNILRKALPDAVGKGIAGIAVCPVRLPVRTKRVA